MFILNLFSQSYNLIYKQRILLTFVYHYIGIYIKSKRIKFPYKEKSKYFCQFV